MIYLLFGVMRIDKTELESLTKSSRRIIKNIKPRRRKQSKRKGALY